MAFNERTLMTVEKEKYELDEQIREEILLLEKEWTKKNIVYLDQYHLQ